jgi:hypothetical protein
VAGFDEATRVVRAHSDVPGIGAGADARPAIRTPAVGARRADERDSLSFDQAYDVGLDPGWTVGGRPNGGYLLATLARAAVDSIGTANGHEHPVAASATFIAAPKPGPAVVMTRVDRLGRSASQVVARLVQDGKVHVDASFVLGRLDPSAEPLWADQQPVDLAPLDDCVRVRTPSQNRLVLAIMDVVDVRIDPRASGVLGDSPNGVADIGAWLRFADGRSPDPLSLVYFSDALPPATLELGRSGWVPTLQLTVYVRAVPAEGPLRARQRARLVEDGMVDEICEIWDARGRMVAQATQLARLRFNGTS